MNKGPTPCWPRALKRVRNWGTGQATLPPLPKVNEEEEIENEKYKNKQN